MKNFLELLDTDLTLTVVVDGNTRQAGLHDSLKFYGNEHVVIDGIEVLPKYYHLVNNGVLHINEPFYCWYHQASNQGWLLVPHSTN